MSKRDTGVVVRYSSAFKCQVVKQIEGGKFTVPEARRVYGGVNSFFPSGYEFVNRRIIPNFAG